MVRVAVALFLVLLSASCARTRGARQAELYERARSMLAEVKDAPELVETVHGDPRVLSALGIFLQAADSENLTAEQMSARFNPLVPSPPWEWAPGIDVHKIRPSLYLVAVSYAAATQPSSLYLFDGSRHVKIDSGTRGSVQVENVVVDGDRIEVVYFPTPSGGAPVMTSAVLEKRGTGWRVDHDTPYRRVTSLLARFSRSEVEDPNVHRDPRLLKAFGVFLASAGRLSQEDLWRHMGRLFPDEWYRAWPTFYIRRTGLALYLVGIKSDAPNTFNGSLYLFEGASHVTLASDDTRWITFENVAVDDRRVEVTYRRGGPLTPYQRESVVAERDGATWRVVPSR